MGLDLSNDVAIYKGLQFHVGHDIVCVQYAGGENLAIECEDCGLVLLSADMPEMDENGDPIPDHDCMDHAYAHETDGAIGHGWSCGVCGEFLQAG